MKYQGYSVEDFIKDEYFKSWVINPTRESDYFWESWIHNHQESRRNIEIAREIILSAKPQKRVESVRDTHDMEEIFDNIIRNHKSGQSRNYPRISDYRSRLIKIAAVLILAVTASIVFTKMADSVVEETPITWIEKENPKGRTSTIHLPDNSTLKLGPNSSVRYTEGFAGTNREIWLTGEAFFEVEKDPDRPFLVYTGNVHTKVLGTSFNVKALAGADHVDVALLSGKVLIENDEHTISQELVPNEKISLEKNSGKVTKATLDYNLDIAWKDGILVLRNESVKSLEEKLENWYNVEVHVQGIRDSYQFKGQFDNKSLEFVMNSISYSAGIDYRLIDNELYIYAKEN